MDQLHLTCTFSSFESQHFFIHQCHYLPFFFNVFHPHINPPHSYHSIPFKPTSQSFLLLLKKIQLDFHFRILENVRSGRSKIPDMAISALNHLPIEYITFDNTLPLSFLILSICIQVSLHLFFDWETKIYTFFIGSDSVQKKKHGVQHERMIEDLPEKAVNKDSSDSMSKGDVEVVFRSLGLLQEREELEGFDSKRVFDMFEVQGPSDDEVRAAFEVFDENKDGFIDAVELQRLLCSLGLKEGSEMENCRRMIMAVDENGDGRIDFSEFVTFMNNIV